MSIESKSTSRGPEVIEDDIRVTKEMERLRNNLLPENITNVFTTVLPDSICSELPAVEEGADYYLISLEVTNNYGWIMLVDKTTLQFATINSIDRETVKNSAKQLTNQLKLTVESLKKTLGIDY